MKLLVMFAASAVSAILVLPTVTQAENGHIKQQVSEVAARHADMLRRA